MHLLITITTHKRFVRQTDLYCETFLIGKQYFIPSLTHPFLPTTVIVEVPKELPTVSMVNTSLKELKRYLTGFDQVVKERTTATAITEGTWGFEHTKACFRDEIIPFIKNLKDIFNNFNRYLVEELADVQKVFYQMEQAVEQHRLESRTFENLKNQDNSYCVGDNSNDCMSFKRVVSNAVHVVKSRAKPNKNKPKKVVQIVLWYLDSGCSKHMTGDRSQLTNFVSKFLGTVKFGNDQVAKIMGMETSDWNARHDLYESPKLKLKRITYDAACAEGKSSKKPQQTQILKTTNKKNSLLHMDYVGQCVLRVSVERSTSSLLLMTTLDLLGRTRRIIETIHVDFDELTAMASEHSSSGPALHEMTPVSISSGLKTLLLFQKQLHQKHAVSNGSPSSTTVDQDAPTPSNSSTQQGTQTPIISHDVEEDNHDIEVAHMGNDPYFGIPIPEVTSDQSSSPVVIHTIVPPNHQVSEHNSKWTKDHPLENIIGALDRPVST
ncbi:hypothetical protein Tco_1167378 [Tanacetum coccineum]